MIVKARDDKENFANLLVPKIDAFPIDHQVGAMLVWRHGWQKHVAEMLNSVFEDATQIIFRKKTTSPELVEMFNQALVDMQKSGDYNNVVRE